MKKETAEQQNAEPRNGEGRKRYDLEERFISFAVRVIRVAEALPKTATGIHVRNQLIRSGTSPAPNYGEAQAAESRADFIHKFKIILKELRETRIWLLITVHAGLVKPTTLLDPLLEENRALIAIAVTSLKTASKRS